MTGKTILHYKILEKLGEGGMGVVYKAEDSKLKRIVALKFLPTHLMSRPRFRTRLEREAQAASSLNHPNICPVYSYHETEDSIFLVMEYIEGETLKQIIEREGQISQEKAVEIITPVAEALAVAHQNGIIHRDVKSENIMIAKDGQVKVMDFGLAKLKDAPTITKSGIPIGTVAYMSPELVQGKQVDHRTDLWSLGVVLFEMLTGELPFKGDSDVGVMYAIVDDPVPKLSKYDAGISNSLQYICTTLLEKDISFRYRNAEKVLDELKHTVKASTTKLAVRKVRKNYRAISIVIVSLLLSIFVANYYYQTRINIPGWLKGNAKLKRVTIENFSEAGRISPDRKYLAYNDSEGFLCLKDLASDEVRRLRESDKSTFHCPVWSPNSDQIAYISNNLDAISIVNIIDEETKLLLKNPSGMIYHVNWSPDGKWIVYLSEIDDDKNGSLAELNLITADGSEHRKLLYRQPGFTIQTAWFPDSKRLAFYDFDSIDGKKIKVIKTVEIEDGSISSLVTKVDFRLLNWQITGLTYSPNGNYLLYPERIDGNVEIIALPVKNEGKIAAGQIIPLTKIGGNGLPFWPCFDKKGEVLSYGVFRNNQDIHTTAIDLKKARFFDNIETVTKTSDYDSDACWSPDGEEIAYISENSTGQDIYIWSERSKEIRRISFDNQAKSQLMFVPNRSALSYISNNAIWVLSLEHKESKQIFPLKTSIGEDRIRRYEWGGKSNSLYIVISLSGRGQSYGQLQKIILPEESSELLIDDIYSPRYAEIRCSHDESYIAIRMDIPDTSHQNIHILNLKSGERKKLASYFANLPWGEMSWTPDNNSIIYGAWTMDARYHIYLESIIIGEIRTLSTRSRDLVRFQGQLSPSGDDMIFYTQSNEADMWILGGKANAN